MYYIFEMRRITKKYERLFITNPELIYDDKDFHIENLEEAIKVIDELLEEAGEDVSDYQEILIDLYEDSPNTLIEKIQLPFFKCYANIRCCIACQETVEILKVKERLKVLLNRLLLFKAFKW